MKLDLETWAKIYPYLEEAHSLAPSEREHWLERLITEKPEIGVPLREVLADSMATVGDDLLSNSFRLSAPLTRVGQVVGAYRIESLLGSGGMGQVWLAQRADGRFSGRFAVKFLNQTVAGAKNLERFKREGRVLARLTHPNIARLIDAGVTQDGQPYLVLEYVEGEPIDAYCAARSLDVRARVRLFLDVLAAVADAHAKLIVHRDIKPPNVFVAADGKVKLLDFGIAKLIGNDLDPEERSAATRIEEIALTPDYAAPEQILGEPVTAATDVYQLGTLLFMLLVGQLPFKSTNTRSDRVRAALDHAPLRLSDVADVSRRKALRGDLDAIVDKALRKQPAERYATAAALANDLQRYLDNEPVNAREGAFAYRAGKFIRRYRGPVIGSTLAALALLAATAFAMVQMHEARLQRDQSRALQKDAQAENQFLMQVMSTVSANSQPVTSTQILEKGMDMLDRQYADDPHFRAGMYERMAARFADMDDWNRAFKTLIKAEAIAAQLDDRSRLAAIECEAVNPEVSMGDTAGAVQRLALGQAALARVASPSADVRAHCIDGEAWVSRLHGDIARAIKLEEQAVALVEADPANDTLHDDLLSTVAYFYNEEGNPKKSLEVTQLLVDHLERVGLGESQNALSGRHNLAVELFAGGEYARALAQEEIVMARSRSAINDGLVDAPRSTAYAACQSRMGHLEAAMATFDGALAAAERDKDQVMIVSTRARRLDTLILLKRFAEAHAEIAKVHELSKGQEVLNSRAVARADIDAAALSLSEGKPAEARRQIEPLLESLQKGSNASPIQLGLAYLTAARIAAADGTPTVAEQHARQALTVYEKLAIDPAASADVGEALLEIAKAQRSQGEAVAAVATARRAVTSLSAGFGSEHAVTREAIGIAGAS